MTLEFLRLGVNIDHVATLRNCREAEYPDIIRAAETVKEAGGDIITVHLREDRRHIREYDVERLLEADFLPLNLEIAATAEMLKLALSYKPHAVCIVPENRKELTTEGGLDVVKYKPILKDIVAALNEKNVRTSLFINPDRRQVDAACEIGAKAIEIHTGAYCDARGKERELKLHQIKGAIFHTEELEIECHAGHGLTYDTVGSVASIPYIIELNIGHFLISEAVFTGLKVAIEKMRACMDMARSPRGSAVNQKIANIQF